MPLLHSQLLLYWYYSLFYKIYYRDFRKSQKPNRRSPCACAPAHIEYAVVSNWKESKLFTDKERAALAASDDITNIAEAGLKDETYKIVSELFTEEEIAQLIMLCSIINAWNRMGISMAG